MLQLPAEHVVCPVQSRTNGAQRTAKRFRRICISQLLEIAEHHRLAIMFRQRKHSFPHRRRSLLPGDSVTGIAIDGQRLRLVIQRAAQPRLRIITFQRPPHVVAGHPEQVGSQRGAGRIEIAARLDKEQKNILGSLSGDQPGAAHVQGEAKDGTLPPAVKGSEGIFVSGQRLRKQLFVGSLGQQLHLEWSTRSRFRQYFPWPKRKVPKSWAPVSYSLRKPIHTDRKST